jgi:RNA polymerase sigma-70 factor (ECF subfamily)
MFSFRRIPNEAEFRRLVDRWAGYVRQVLISIDGRRSPEDLEELEQDVRLKLWQVLSRERVWDKPASFIRSVVMSVAIDAARKRQVRGGSAEHIGLDQMGSGSPDAVADLGPDQRAELRVLLERLGREDEDKAQALGLYLQGFTTAEIGTLLGWTEAKARNTVYRTLESLRAQMEGTEHGPGE